MRKNLLVFCGCVLLSTMLYGQGRLLNKALDAANKGVTNAITKKVESVAKKRMEVFLNKKLSAYEQELTEENKKYQAAIGTWQDSLVAMSSVPFEDEYVFNTLVCTDIVMTDEKRETETMECTYYMNSEAEYYGYGVGSMITVIDYKNGVMVSFSSDENGKIYFAYKTSLEALDTETNEQLEKFTGEKVICGYSCSGYKIVGVNYNGICWVSSSPDFAANYTNLYMPKRSQGFPLAMEGVISGEDGHKVTYVSEAKSVKTKESFIIKKSDYKNMFE